MSACACERTGNLVRICQPCTDRKIEAIYTKWPGLRDFKPDADLDRCCQSDQVADLFGWDAAWEWDDLRFRRGDA